MVVRFRRDTGVGRPSAGPVSSRRLPPGIAAALLGDPYDELDVFDGMMADKELLEYGQADGPARRLWQAHGARLITSWAERHPGTRPVAWWAWEAPRRPVGEFKGWYFDGHLPAPRLRLGGKGTPAHEVNATFPTHHFGIPAFWATISRADPPKYESQATFLKRHGLLLPGEAARLRPTDFEPEIVREPEGD